MLRDALFFLLAFVLALVGCGGPAPVGSACVEGVWIDATSSCANHPSCASGAAASECAMSDCQVQSFTDYLVDGGFAKAAITISLQSRQFSKGGPVVTGAWGIDGGALVVGSSEFPLTCSASQIVLGSGPLAPGETRADAELQAAIRQSEISGSWTKVSF